ncbi:hypothetical protein CAJCM15448_06710 [Candidozyma auris]|nr:hypothetical protein CAJCM15448_06710 [[Candida] auris]
MSSSHVQNNYTRRNSAASPYSIPARHNNTPHLSSSLGPDQGYAHDHLHSQIHAHSYNSKSPSRHSIAGPAYSRGLAGRRISEGESGRMKQKLNCEACGKGYKHVSSLAKHLWEHTPEWKMTKKFVMSKHQQVQLLEAASILVGMNENGTEEGQSEPSSLRMQRRLSARAFSPQQQDSLRFNDSFGTSNGFEVESHTHTPSERSFSFSDHPPSAVEISKLYPGHVGGYIDVPSREYIKKREEKKEDDYDSDEEIIGKME